jgi:hypothetical protein
MKSLLRGTNWVFKWNSLRFVFKGFKHIPQPICWNIDNGKKLCRKENYRNRQHYHLCHNDSLLMYTQQTQPVHGPSSTAFVLHADVEMQPQPTSSCCLTVSPHGFRSTTVHCFRTTNISLNLIKCLMNFNWICGNNSRAWEKTELTYTLISSSFIHVTNIIHIPVHELFGHAETLDGSAAIRSGKTVISFTVQITMNYQHSVVPIS